MGQVPVSLLRQIWLIERLRLVLWCPVGIGLGVWLYFSRPMEPTETFLALVMAGLVGVAGVLTLWRGVLMAAIPLVAMLCVGLGFTAGGVRARLVAAPVLAAEIDATVEGRVRAVSRSRSGAPRVTLDRLFIFGLSGAEAPARVRITLKREQEGQRILPGQRISVFARLSPPGGPVEPGAFDFRRYAWFRSLGGIGYAHGPAVEIEGLGRGGPWDRLVIRAASIRAGLSRRLTDELGGERGAFAAAITTGDRAGVSDETMQALRDSNLAHLLAISGLHMGLLSGLVFVLVRFALALAPRAALIWNGKKIAAAAAVGAGLCYLGVSGASIATQRAFIMLAVMFVAVLVDRPAVTLRALAMAAALILLFRPESLLDAGFQLSFAATAALIAAYEALRDRFSRVTRDHRGFLGGVGRYAAALLLTSFVAGLATAPYAGFHFNRLSTVGLLANFGAVPVMGLWIMPSVIAAAALSLFGQEALAFDVMAAGIDVVLWVAHSTASIDGAARPVAAGPVIALTLITLGGLWLCLWRSRMRLIGLAPLAGAFVLWSIHQRPDVLVAPNVALIGVASPEGRVLDLPKGQGFAAETWLRRDGDPAEQAVAAARIGFARARKAVTFTLENGWTVHATFDRDAAPGRLAPLCTEKTLLLARHATAGPKGPCQFYGARRLASAVAITQSGDRLDITIAGSPRQSRLWTRKTPGPGQASPQ